MKKLLTLTTLLLLLGGCSSQYTFNGLLCPIDDPNQIQADLASCKVYDLKAIDKALNNNKECKACLEAKGYRVDPNDSK